MISQVTDTNCILKRKLDEISSMENEVSMMITKIKATMFDYHILKSNICHVTESHQSLPLYPSPSPHHKPVTKKVKCTKEPRGTIENPKTPQQFYMRDHADTYALANPHVSNLQKWNNLRLQYHRLPDERKAPYIDMSKYAETLMTLKPSDTSLENVSIKYARSNLMTAKNNLIRSASFGNGELYKTWLQCALVYKNTLTHSLNPPKWDQNKYVFEIFDVIRDFPVSFGQNETLVLYRIFDDIEDPKMGLERLEQH